MPSAQPPPEAPPEALPPLPVIGLTGGIAAGKSTVSAQLAKLDAHIIDADSVGHAVITPQGEAYPEVVAAFGTEILEEDGTISRRKLGAIVFAEPARLEELNAISHPRMAERMARDIAALRRRRTRQRPRAIVLDAAILFEAGWDHLCDVIWTVEAPSALAIQRLIGRNAMTREDAQARLDAQMGNAERARRAHRVLHNDGTLEALAGQVARAWAETIPAG